jgi:hypothetical protein
MDKKDMCAFPFEGGNNNGNQPDSGMTLRDYVAANALNGLLVNAGRNGLVFENVAEEAVKQADKLLALLNT